MLDRFQIMNNSNLYHLAIFLLFLLANANMTKIQEKKNHY